MLFFHMPDLTKNVMHLVARPLNSRIPVALTLPPLNVEVHLVVSAALLLRVLAEPADIFLILGFVDKLEAARLSNMVSLVALLPEITPTPRATFPAGLLKEAHPSRPGHCVFTKLLWLRTAPHAVHSRESHVGKEKTIRT
jgi:hypothetical protein